MAHILIAADDEIIAQLASEVLMDAGHACGWVTDGEKAVDLLRWRRPDLLLLDQDMPGLSGSQVLRSLRGSAENYDLPVVMFTGVTGAEGENTAYFNGAQAYLRKPFEAEALIRTVEEILQPRSDKPRHRTLVEHLEYATGRWRDAPSRRAVS
ncbi:response regulator [Erythrobacter sp. SD-21]|uniref:response regulator n=1 Tax=Erythrobacter sp. SD-21 TaxID=161528 RepID=UPI000153FAA4|nr:response regulator [Erythrobacter sp. SD-21]EDL48126.1 response regulator receiver domain protein (CheY-like) [Erythrobacter sp. SD-21]